jgi:hypothetical protein
MPDKANEALVNKLIAPLEQKGNAMAFQKKTNYMAEVEMWLREEIFSPIRSAHESGDAEELKVATDRSVKAIKEKLLESYRNGQTSVKSKTNA